MSKMKYEPVLHDHEEFINRLMKRKGFKEKYMALEEEYSLIKEMINARARAGLTQEAVAKRMGTTKSAISRLEGINKSMPSLNTLIKYAKAVGCSLEIKLKPKNSKIKQSK